MPYKKVDITGEGTEVVDGGRGTPVDVVQEPTNELEKANTRFIASDKAPKKTVVDSDLQVLGKYYDKDGNEIGGGGESVVIVEITGLSGTLTDEQYNKLSGDNAVLKAGTQYYYKNFDASTLILYTAAPREATGKTIVDQYEITKATKGYQFKYFENASSNQFRELTKEEVDYQPEGYLVPKSPDYENDSKAFWFQYDSTPSLISDGAVGVWATRDTSDNSQYLYVEPYIKTRKVKTYELELTDTNRFTPATTGTITKAEASEYVRKIQSGQLCSVNGYNYQIIKYDNSATEGDEYLILSYIFQDDIPSTVAHSYIKYTVDSNGTLTVSYYQL